MSQNVKLIDNSAAAPVYRGLRLKDREFRLITIHPALNFMDRIECSLSVHKPAEKSYKTLSYVWRHDMAPKQITVEGCAKFLVTASLEAAMRILRRQSEDVIIWIDAISINQLDMIERDAQVKRMSDLYVGADETVIWLGAEREESRRACNFLKYWEGEFVAVCGGSANNVWGAWHADVEKRDRMIKRFEGKVERVDGRMSMLDEKNWNAVAMLAKRPWWKRLWVFQEAVLSKAVRFQCGYEDVAWSTMEMIPVLIELGDTIRKTRIPPHESKLNKTARLIDQTFNTDSKEWSIYQYRYQHHKHARPDDPLDVVSELSHRKASDPKDKIFGVTGLLPLSKIDVKYSSSVEAVYLKFAKDQMTVKGTRLRILSFAGIGLVGHRESQRLPSWVPDWRLYEEGNRNARHMPKPLNADMYRAGGDRMHESEARLGTNSITVKGVHFDIISKRDSMGSGDGRKYKFGFDLLKLPSHDAKSVYPTGCCRMHALVRTLLMDSPDGSRRINRAERDEDILLECMAGISVWYHLNRKQRGPGYPIEENITPMQTLAKTPRLEDTKDTPEDWGVGSLYPWSPEVHTNSSNAVKQWPNELNFEQAMLKGSNYLGNESPSMKRPSTDQRTFFGTQKGYFGLGPADLAEGDLVCVLFGCSVPHLLRKKGNGYLLVGEAYVHGIMDGEAIDTEMAGKIGSTEFTIF